MPRAIVILSITGWVCAQPVTSTRSFEVASVRPSQSIVGHDGVITTDPQRLTVRNATLKRLIFEAYQIPYAQIGGGPDWLDAREFDIEARAPNPATAEQMKLMLRTLLKERFHLTLHREMKERRAYALVIAKNGPKLRKTPDATSPGTWRFRGDLSQFASRLAIQLTIPLPDDPATPSRASGAAIPVIDETGIEGVCDISLDLKPDAGADAFTIWQRALREQLGLKLESRKAPVEMLVIESAEKPIGN